MADSVSGELVIVPDAEALGTITGNTYDWAAAIAFAESYTDGVNSDYRLITKAEALEILTNSTLVSQLELPIDNNYWTIEEFEADDAWAFDFIGETGLNFYPDSGLYYALPVRKVNFYGLPLIDSEFGGGLVFDVVAETRMVHVAAKPADWGDFGIYDWVESGEQVLSVINGYLFDGLPTRAQALKIFGNSYLVTLLGLPVDDDYWTSEEQNLNYAYSVEPSTQNTSLNDKVELFYALPIRSEVVPET